MTMIKSLKIERFRGINSLDLKDFSAVNIFVGGNGIGKTSILEAVGIASSPSNPPFVIPRFGQWRGQPLLTASNDEAVATFFHKSDFDHGPKFEFLVDSARYTFTISKLTNLEGVALTIDPSAWSSSNAIGIESLRGLQFIFSPPTGKAYASRLFLLPNGAQGQIDGRMYEHQLGFFFISGRTASSVGETANVLTELSRHYQGEKILRAIKDVHEDIRSIEAGVINNAPAVLVDTGLPRKMPITVLGDGFCRTALMLTGMYYTVGRILVVDEIDSGLHKSVMESFWKTCINCLRDTKKQLFCTTHSEEMLDRTLEAFADAKDMLRIYRIDQRKDGKTVSASFDYESFSNSERMGLDVR
jgi:hypothetical protein